MPLNANKIKKNERVRETTGKEKKNRAMYTINLTWAGMAATRALLFIFYLFDSPVDWSLVCRKWAKKCWEIISFFPVSVAAAAAHSTHSGVSSGEP